MGSDLFIIIAIGAIIGLILFIFGKYAEMAGNYFKDKGGRRHGKAGSETPRPKKDAPPTKTFCPLCDSALTPGINLFSKVYRPLSSQVDDDQHCTIQGCPFCYSKDGEKKKRRSCPVCGRPVPMTGSLVARMTMQKSGRRHVHIIGCTECHKKV